MFRGQHRRIRLLFAAADVLLIGLAFELAYLLRAHSPFERNFYLSPEIAGLLAGWSMLVWPVLGYGWGIYDRIEAAARSTMLRDAFRQCLVGSASLVLFQYLLRLDLSRSFLSFFAALTWIILSLFRLNATRLVSMFRREFGAPHFVMIVGVGSQAFQIARQVEESARYGIRLSGFIDDAPGPSAVAAIDPGRSHLKQSYPVHSLDDLPQLLEQHVIDAVIFAVDNRRLAELEDVLLMCDEEGVRTHIPIGFFPHVNSQVYLDRLGASPLLTFSGTPHDEIRLLLKRMIDILLAGIALVLLSPMLILVFLLIRLTSRGPVIYRQTRCGLNGRRFVFYKFRSMQDNAEALRGSLEHLSDRKTALKIPNDPRLTGVGRWLRKFSIDELPQLWNVLKGDMSLVGPRPPLPEEVEQYERWQRRRLRMRPGLTSLWAVSGRDSVDFETWMRLDMEYIDNWSLGLDWRIILRTVPQVILGKGAH